MKRFVLIVCILVFCISFVLSTVYFSDLLQDPLGALKKMQVNRTAFSNTLTFEGVEMSNDSLHILFAKAFLKQQKTIEDLQCQIDNLREELDNLQNRKEE